MITASSVKFTTLNRSITGKPQNRKFRTTITTIIRATIQNPSQLKQRRSQNVHGDFFVDHTCIDCDTCRWMAPKIFTRVDEKSAVSKQPDSAEERIQALQALLACPTSSIRTEKPPHDILEAQKKFPHPIDLEKLPGVFHCGYHSEASFGATSYLIVHPEGNILVDGPRFTEKLAQNIDMLGGARYLFLTHSDDVADHDKWSKRLNCDRIIHSKEVDAYTANAEMKLEGSGPWSIGSDIEIIHTPGHSEGSICLFYKPLKALFTGDHLCKREDKLCMIEMYNHFSISAQVNSIRMLLDLDFEWILPGHLRRVQYRDKEEKNAALEAFLATREI
ncbi:hypothetical protein ACHQM5_011178 [Ranunculus cassubicifolius]